MTQVKITLKEGAILPEYKTIGSAGADVSALVNEPVVIKPTERALIPTGIFMEIPENFEMQVRPRSGLAIEHGITLPNSPGTIDSDYRGELKIILINHGNKNFTVTNGMRIAQIILTPVVHAQFMLSNKLNPTERSEGGFGHTGL
jgi:dUTP pyrophosphatase